MTTAAPTPPGQRPLSGPAALSPSLQLHHLTADRGKPSSCSPSDSPGRTPAPEGRAPCPGHCLVYGTTLLTSQMEDEQLQTHGPAAAPGHTGWMRKSAHLKRHLYAHTRVSAHPGVGTIARWERPQRTTSPTNKPVSSSNNTLHGKLRLNNESRQNETKLLSTDLRL